MGSNTTLLKSVFFISLVTFTLYSLAQADKGQTMLPVNPYEAALAPLENPNYVINIRIIDHSARYEIKVLERLVHATEAIYSQCPGVKLKVQIVGWLKASPSILQDTFNSFANDRIILNQSFFDFFLPWIENRSNAIDVHLVDHFSEENRNAASQNLPISNRYLGQAYSADVVDNLYVDSRQTPEMKTNEISGSSLIIAIETMAAVDGERTLMRDASRKQVIKQWNTWNTPLLTHELGHILLESQDGKGGYTDHYCPDTNTYCASDFLMAAGGSKEQIFVEPGTATAIGFAPLPKVDIKQCSTLINHPLINRQ